MFVVILLLSFLAEVAVVKGQSGDESIPSPPTVIISGLSTSKRLMDLTAWETPSLDEIYSSRKKRSAEFIINFFKRCPYEPRSDERAWDCRGCYMSYTALSIASGEVCWHHKTCPPSQVLSPDCSSCIHQSYLRCSNVSKLLFDDMVCRHNPTISNFNVTIIPQDYCKLAGKEISKCDAIRDNVNWVDWFWTEDGFLIADNFQFSETQNLGDISYYNCKRSTDEYCSPSNCARGECTGDKSYFENFGATGSYKDCHCTLNDKKRKAEVSIFGRKTTEPFCWGKSRVRYQVSAREKRHANFECTSCKITCDGNIIVLQTGELEVMSITAYKNGYSRSVPGKVGSGTVRLSRDQKSSNSTAIVHAWFKGIQSYYETTVECPVGDKCMDVHWVDFYTTKDCIPWWVYAVVIVAFILTIAISCCLLSCCCTATTNVLKPFRPCMEWLSLKIRGGKAPVYTQDVESLYENPMYEELRHRNVQDTEPLLEVAVSGTKAEKKAKALRILMLNKALGLAIIIALIGTTTACSEFTSFSVQSDACVNSEGSIQECTMSTSQRLLIAPVGQTSCDLLKDLNGNHVGSLNFLTKSIDLVCDSDHQYYIFKPEAFDKGIFRCDGAEYCDVDFCRKFTKDTMLAEWESTKGKLCESSCIWTPSTGQGCAWRNGCGTHRICIKPANNDIARVFKCERFVYEVSFEFIQNSLTNSTTKTIILRSNQPYQDDNFKISLVSATLPTVPALSECFIQGAGYTFMAQCSPKASPQKGLIGEVQCQKKEWATEWTQDCLRSDGLVSTKSNLASGNLYTSFLNWEPMKVETGLPRRIGDVLLTASRDQKTIRAEYTSSALFELQLDTSNYRIIPKVQKTSCEASFISGSGVKNGDSTIQLEVYTRTGQALVFFDCKAIRVSSTFMANTSKHIHSIHVKIQDKEVDTICTIKCPANMVELVVKFQLEDETVMKHIEEGVVLVNNPVAEEKSIWDKIIDKAIDVGVKYYLAFVPTVVVCLGIGWLLFQYLTRRAAIGMILPQQYRDVRE
jgi:hypothetical protein